MKAMKSSKHQTAKNPGIIGLFILLFCFGLLITGCSCARRIDAPAKDSASPKTADIKEQDNNDHVTTPSPGISPTEAVTPDSREVTEIPVPPVTPTVTNAPDSGQVTDAPASDPTPTATGNPDNGQVTDIPTAAITPTPTNPPKDTRDDDTTGVDNSSLATPSNSGALQVAGTQLCDKSGNPVQLRGVSTHGIAWFPDYVNAQLFTELKTEWRANIVRLAMYTDEYAGYCSGGDKAKLKKLVKDGVKYAADADLYVIIDWHVLNDRDPNAYISEAKKFFKEMSEEYASYDNVIYEICNEPNGGTSWASIKKYALEIIPIIKANNPDAVIIVGTPNWSQYVDQAAQDPITGYTNIMYALHFYAATHKDNLRRKMTDAIGAGLPIFVTEYGICDASGNGGIDYDSADTWTSLMDKNGVSYVCWNLSNKNETSALFKSSCSKTSGFSMDDMSDEGKWLRKLLGNSVDNGGKTSDNRSGNSDNNSDNGSSNSSNGSNGSDSTNGADDTGSGSDNTGNGTTPASPLPAEGVSGGISYTLTISNSWESEGCTFFQYDLTVKNTGTAAIDTWSITIPVSGKISVSNIWCAAASVSDTALIISNESFNGQIAPGSEVSGIGIILSVK